MWKSARSEDPIPTDFGPFWYSPLKVYSVLSISARNLNTYEYIFDEPNIKKKKTNSNNSVVLRLCIIDANERYEQSSIFQITHLEIYTSFSSNRNDITTLVIMENTWWYEMSFVSFIADKSKYTDSFISASISKF